MKNAFWTSYFILLAVNVLAVVGACGWVYTGLEEYTVRMRWSVALDDPLCALIACTVGLTVLILYPLFRWLFRAARPANTTTALGDDAAVYVAMFILLIIAFPAVFVLICCALWAVIAGYTATLQGAIAQ